MKFFYECYTEYFNGGYHTTTKVYDSRRKKAADWQGCHWNDPLLLVSEQVDGLIMSDEMARFIDKVNAVEIED